VRPVRPVLVVMSDVLIQDRVQVPLPGDERPVGDLRPDRTHPAFGISVRPQRGGIFTTSIPAPEAWAARHCHGADLSSRFAAVAAKATTAAIDHQALTQAMLAEHQVLRRPGCRR